MSQSIRGSAIGTTGGAATIRRIGSDPGTPNNVGRMLPHQILPNSEWFALMSRELWQFKVGAHLECHLGCSDRTARAWASGDNEPPARALALLLRTEDGPRILSWIMRDDPPAWWGALRASAQTLSQFGGK